MTSRDLGRPPRPAWTVPAVTAFLIGALVGTAAAASVPTSLDEADWQTCAAGSGSRQADFDRAAEVSGVPVEIMLGVSYMLTRWDDHGGQPSASGGHGPMHLTVPPGSRGGNDDSLRKGLVDPSPGTSTSPAPSSPSQAPASPSPAPASLSPEVEAIDEDARLDQLTRAAELTGLSPERLAAEPPANICGGAALLAHHRPAAWDGERIEDWAPAVARYVGATGDGAASRFASLVFDVIRSGEQRTTNDGQEVSLPPTPDVTLDPDALAVLGLDNTDSPMTECPPELGCAWIPAPYDWYGEPDPTTFGNHDLGDRPTDLEITHIVIHDTEETFEKTIDLILDPEYVSWNYTIRSSDGMVAQHIHSSDVAWHDGNWYSNTHSIGIEHEGYAAHGATWYTEIMYRNSADLVRYLADEFDVPLDRGHIIGHDNVPAPLTASIPTMHWDPGPYWDWEHYFELLGAPIGGPDAARDGVAIRPGQAVVVAPGFDDNQQVVLGCSGDADVPCRSQGSNFVYLHTEPSSDSPLVTDPGLATGEPATRHVSDVGAQAPAGHRFHVAERNGDWLGVWYLGKPAWLYSPVDDPTVVVVPPDEQPRIVVAAGDEPIPVYGEAIPEASEYPAAIPPRDVTSLVYTIEPGQAYVLADTDFTTDYYYANTYDCASAALDCTVVSGTERYYWIWFGYRMAFVRADDVEIQAG